MNARTRRLALLSLEFFIAVFVAWREHEQHQHKVVIMLLFLAALFLITFLVVWFRQR